MGKELLTGKQVGSQASFHVTWWLAWIQSVCINILFVSPHIIKCKSNRCLVQLGKLHAKSVCNWVNFVPSR